jgi:heat-inducible transcriptional repressor
VGCVIDEILDALDEADRDRLFHVGVPALLAQPEFADAERAGPLIEFLEDGIAVLEALSDAFGCRELTVRIGHENRRSELGNVSIVATNYGAGSADGVIGVIGPTRMDYSRAMSAVRAVSDDLTDALS